MMTKALTGLFLVASVSCLAICAYKRRQGKKVERQKTDTQHPSHDDVPVVS